MSQRCAVCCEKDVAKVSRQASGVTKPTPVVYAPTPPIEAGNRVDEDLEMETGTVLMWRSVSKLRQM
jgi:hypothetical protein